MPLASDGGGQSMDLDERPAEQDEEVMRRLGFDVERRDVSEGLECIEVGKENCREWNWVWSVYSESMFPRMRDPNRVSLGGGVGPLCTNSSYRMWPLFWPSSKVPSQPSLV